MCRSEGNVKLLDWSVFMYLELNRKAPIYLQLAHRIRLNIYCGTYGQNEELPSYRKIAEELHIAINTVQRSYAVLEREGLLIFDQRKRCFVTVDDAVIKAKRANAAQKICNDFFKSMYEIGYYKSDIIKEIESWL